LQQGLLKVRAEDDMARSTYTFSTVFDHDFQVFSLMEQELSRKSVKKKKKFFTCDRLPQTRVAAKRVAAFARSTAVS
jgi:hypothetical protein